ncbi:MurR/RpiR family transcriptional regulator [Roseinatronobacter sp. S2]|uniref:MurR/RpiR family transcriptional regulator n=1 Tax=Roseinatronobacter sp. S2 TaxID=3035471 RepID=UPI00240FCC0E|nr:MurR/RpiR family transcriptional regulator [Roseinatronobacter sp. S2]MCC5958583.1 MurR/RpiR family transcriptional regulator [Paracoccaceae bacterium]WFE74648.1 MurR/RpiR family transcriptional regulator [Roseinatronobacter sp. S2]
MQQKNTPLFTTRVRDALPIMHPSEKRLAELVLNFPGELASYSATELARLANVSNATVTRFVRKVGYTNFEEARQHVRDNKQAGASLFRVAPGTPGKKDFIAAHVLRAQSDIEQTFQLVAEAEIDALARQIIGARRVWLLGMRRSATFAQYLGLQMFQVIPQISVIPSNSETLGEAVSAISAKDCVIAFGLRRSVSSLPQVMEQVVKSGASVAYIHDTNALPELPFTWRFMCETASPGPLFNHAAVLTLCHIIATRVIELSGVAGRRRMSTIEAIHNALDEV